MNLKWHEATIDVELQVMLISIIINSLLLLVLDTLLLVTCQ